MIFSRNLDIYKNAFPNWQKHFRNVNDYFALYSTNFKESADILIESIGNNRDHIADTIINPALYLYRHSIELCLKAILYFCYIKRRMDSERIKEKLIGHDLKSLWSKVDNELRNNYNIANTSENSNELKNIGNLIMELHVTDDSSMTLRYPFDKEFQEYVYGDGKESYGIDFNNLKTQISYLHSRLYYWIYEYVSSEGEEQ